MINEKLKVDFNKAEEKRRERKDGRKKEKKEQYTKTKMKYNLQDVILSFNSMMLILMSFHFIY